MSKIKVDTIETLDGSKSFNVADLSDATHPIEDVLTSTSTNSSLSANQGRVLKGLVDDKQDALVSGTSIKTINGTSLLGGGDLTVGSGDVVGPSGSASSNFALFDGTTGKLLKDTGVKAADFASASHTHVVTAETVVGLIAVDTTLNVPAQYPTVKAAFDYLRTNTIAKGAVVTVKVADGTHDYTGGQVSLNHPQGPQIKLIGNTTSPTSCVLTWTNTSTGTDALVVSDGNVLGYIDGFHVTRTAHAGSSISTGLLADNGAAIMCGPNMRVTNHYYPIAARSGSYIKADYAVVDGGGDVGIWAVMGSTVDCTYVTVTNTADPLTPLGFGIQAEYGSSVNCNGASSSGAKVAGIAALSGSSVRCHSATASNNTGSGVLARDGATIEAHGATTSNNGRYGIEEITSGTVYYSSITQSGNTLGNRAPVAVANSDASLGARVSSTSGALRLDTSSTSPVYFHTSGGLQFEVGHAASSVNRGRVKGSATGSAVVFDAEGSDTNIDVTVRGKGTGSVFIGNSQAAYVRMNGASTGGTPALRAEGSDANIDLLLGGKGTGVLRWGTHSAGTPTPNGYVEWKLADGSTVRVAAQKL